MKTYKDAVAHVAYQMAHVYLCGGEQRDPAQKAIPMLSFIFDLSEDRVEDDLETAFRDALHEVEKNG